MIRNLSILFVLTFTALTGQVVAQCTPDLSITTPGIYPDSATGLASGTVGVPYNEVIQVKVLTDTSLAGIPVTIVNITVDNVSGLPPGLTYACNPSSCIFPGGSNGCILISGTPTVAGDYQLVVDVTANGLVFGAPISQPSTIDYYHILINGPSGLPGDMSAVKFDLVQLNPNPAVNYTDVSYSSPVAGDFTLKLYNMIGKEVSKQNVRGMAGMNTTRFMLDDVAPGVYMLSIENGTSVITKRMIVSRK